MQNIAKVEKIEITLYFKSTSPCVVDNPSSLASMLAQCLRNGVQNASWFEQLIGEVDPNDLKTEIPTETETSISITLRIRKDLYEFAEKRADDFQVTPRELCVIVIQHYFQRVYAPLPHDGSVRFRKPK